VDTQVFYGVVAKANGRDEKRIGLNALLKVGAFVGLSKYRNTTSKQIRTNRKSET